LSIKILLFKLFILRNYVDPCGDRSIPRQSPRNVKEVQWWLMGRVVALSRFMPQMTEKVRPILGLLRMASRFHWDERCAKLSINLRNSWVARPLFRSRSSGSLFWYTCLSLRKLWAQFWFRKYRASRGRYTFLPRRYKTQKRGIRQSKRWCWPLEWQQGSWERISIIMRLSSKPITQLSNPF